ncbi:MAG: divalent-cation tolerance protein CutA [Anaerolineae bacterium]
MHGGREAMDVDGEFRVVLVTAPPDVAERLAGALVSERLAACVNIIPAVRSVYRWQGEIQWDNEALLLIKTSTALLPCLTERVQALHPYDVPEILALPIVSGNRSYLNWLSSNLSLPGCKDAS